MVAICIWHTANRVPRLLYRTLAIKFHLNSAVYLRPKLLRGRPILFLYIEMPNFQRFRSLMKSALTLMVASLLPFLGWGQRALTISDAVRTARDNNTVLKTEKFNLEIARADMITAALRPNPVLNNQSLQLVKSSFYPNDTRWSSSHNRQVWWQLTRPFQWNAIRSGKINVASHAFAVAENSYLDFERSLSYDVASKFLETWRLKQVLSTLEQAQRNFDSLVLIQQARFRAQAISSTELLRTQIPLEQYKLQLKTAQQEYMNNVGELKFLLGSNDSIDVAATPLTEPIPINGTIDSLISRIMRERPDVRAALADIERSESNVDLQRAARIPIPELGMIWNPQNTIPYLGFYGTMQIPISSRNQGGIARAQAERDQTRMYLNTMRLQVTTEVTAAWNTYHLQKVSIGRYTEILTQSNEVLRSVRYSYLRGGTTLIDLLEAERSWYETQKLYYEAQALYYESYLKLLLAAGLIAQL